MAGITAVNSGGGSDALLQAYRAQLDLLEADPNATQAYKDALEKWFKAMQEALGQNGSDPWSTDNTAGPDSSPAPTTPSDSTSNPDSYPSSTSPVGQNTLDPNSASAPGGNGPLGGNAPEALKELAPMISEASKLTGVPENLIAAQIWQESRGVANSSSTNPGNGQTDTGLMQINPATFAELQQRHPELQGKSLSDPLTNIAAGAFYLQDLKQQFGSWELALRGYVSGPGSVDPNNPNVTTTGIGDPTYVQKVVQFANDLKNGTPLPA